MGFKEFMKAKSIGEYLGAKKDPKRMAEIGNRTVGQALKNVAKTDKSVQEDKHAIKCPHCKSLNVQFLQQDKKGFSLGKAVGGTVLVGDVGALAGFAGKKGKMQWHCQNCGRTFETN